MIAKLEWTQSNAQRNRTITESHNESNNQQQINNNRTTALERTAAKAIGGCLNAFYWYKIITLDSAVVEAQTMLSSHGGFLTIAMYHHRETIYIQINALWWNREKSSQLSDSQN